MNPLEGYEFSDRYDAIGIPHPDPATVCKGQCEGVGCYPVDRPGDEDATYRAQAWRDAERASPADDGWHFIRCEDCNGTGRR